MRLGLLIQTDIQKGDKKMFCPKCGTIMMIKKHGARRVLECKSCGCIDKSEEHMVIKEKTKAVKIDVVDASADDNALPKTDAECPKCKNREAYYWTVQTRASDEPETKFFKCTKCKHIWRDYD
jgi:DNA-directed RNA polymerase subunit M